MKKHISPIIKARINGNIINDVKMAIKKHVKYNNELSLVFLKYFLHIYFLGSRNQADLNRKYMRKAVETYNKENCYDLGIFKVPMLQDKFKPLLVEELNDFILPLFYDTAPFSWEGTYENFGVNVAKNDVIIDAGANIGIFSALAAARGAKKVFAFEPLKKVIPCIVEISKINGFDNVIEIIEKGLSNEAGVFRFNIGENMNEGSLVLDESREQAIEIPTITLDDFVEENNIDRIDFIKSDIEGAERLLLKGANKTLKKHKPKLAICTYHIPDDKEVLSALIKQANPEYNIYYSERKLFAK